MRARIDQWIDRLRTGFWFLPCLMIFLAAALALILLWLDEKVDPGINASLAWAYSGGPNGARPLLSTIAGSMITAASVTFSLASVASVDCVSTVRIPGFAKLHARPYHSGSTGHVRLNLRL